MFVIFIFFKRKVYSIFLNFDTNFKPLEKRPKRPEDDPCGQYFCFVLNCLVSFFYSLAIDQHVKFCISLLVCENPFQSRPFCCRLFSMCHFLSILRAKIFNFVQMSHILSILHGTLFGCKCSNSEVFQRIGKSFQVSLPFLKIQTNF